MFAVEGLGVRGSKPKPGSKYVDASPFTQSPTLDGGAGCTHVNPKP